MSCQNIEENCTPMLTEFIGNLACPLDVGHALVIVGKTIDGASRFHINLRTGKHEKSDIGLRLSCRFRQNAITRNAFIDGEWGIEEIENYLDVNYTTKNPLIPGEFFMICILICETQYFISINNRPYCIYKYRLPINKIRTIEIKEHIQVLKQIDHRTIYPYSWPPLQTICTKEAFSNDIPILFTPGHVIVITARVFGNSRGQFIIKFFESDSKRELLHFNPRFETNVVVRNAMKSNLDFGLEEREGGFPFQFNEQFCLAIAFGEKAFFFAINGKYFSSFVYRTSDCLHDLNGFKITTGNGMQIHVTGVDHIHMQDPECQGFEDYSRYDIEIE